MVKAFHYQSPDTRIRHLRYAREQEEQRRVELDEAENQRKQQLAQEFEVERQRGAALDERRSLNESMRFEQARAAELDRREAQETERQRAEMEARVGRRRAGVFEVPGDPTLEPGGRVLPQEAAPYFREMLPRWQRETQYLGPGGQIHQPLLPVPGEPMYEPTGRIEPTPELYPGVDVPQFGLRRAADITRAGGDLALAGVVQPVLEAAQYVEEPLAAAALQAVSRTGPLGGPALGPGQQVTEMPMEREPIGEELVNPIKAWLGSGEEQRRVEEVLEEAGLPASIIAQMITSPLNLLPIVGFTKADDFVRVLRQAARLTGEARLAVMESPRMQTAIRGLSRGIRAGERGGPELGRGGLPRPRPGEPLPVGEPPAPPKPPEAAIVPEPPEPPKLPTIREVEARAVPPSPEVRAQMMDEVADVSVPLERWDDFQARWGPRYQENWWTKIEDTVGGPLARTPEEKATRAAFVQGDLYREIQKTRARLAVWDWLGRNQRTLGLNSEGAARNVKPRPGADIPRKLVQRLEHITEHPEKYIIAPEQQAALDEAQNMFRQALKTELSEGVDVMEVMGGYWRRLIKRTPGGKSVGTSGGMAMPRVKPEHARSRIFGDIEELARWDAANGGKLKLGSGIQGMADRLSSAADAIANRRVVNELRNMGVKPSERISAEVAERAKVARQAYKEARAAASRRGSGLAERTAATEAEVELVNARRALRAEAKLAAERRPKILGRLVTEEAAEQMGRYLDAAGPDAIQEAFRLARASNIVGDLSAMGIQGWSTFWAHNPTWWNATFKSIEALVHNPYRYVAQNAAAIERGTRVGAIVVPEEFLLRRGGKLAQRFVELPIIRNTQNAFEWWTFVAQAERWKIVEQMARTPDDLLELANVIRNQTGVALMPGLTKAQSRGAQSFFAPKFLAAMLSGIKDVARPGVAGHYARRNMGMAFGGALATIAAGNFAQGKVPNLTDPDGAGFFGIPVDKGYIYPMGPFHPLVVTLFRSGRAAQDLIQGEMPRPRDVQAWPRFLEGKLNKYERALIRAAEAMGIPVGSIRGQPFRGPEIGVGRGGIAGEIGEVAPIGPYQAIQGFREGAYVTGAEVAGVRTTVVTPYQTFMQGWKEEYPDRKYNYEVDNIVAEANPDLAPLLEARRERTAEYGTPSSIMREVNVQFRAQQEEDMGLVESARRWAAGDTAVGPQLMADYREYKAVIANAMARAMFGIETNPKTPEGKALKAWAEIDPYDEKYRDPATREIDYDAWSKERDAAFEKIRSIYPGLADALETRLRTVDPGLRELEPQFEEAIDIRRRLYDMPRWEGVDAETATKIQDFIDFVEVETARAKREGYDISGTEMAIILGRKNNKPNLGRAVSQVIAGKAPWNLEMVNEALRNQEILSLFFPRDLDNFLPVEAEREALGEEAFNRLVASR